MRILGLLALVACSPPVVSAPPPPPPLTSSVPVASSAPVDAAPDSGAPIVDAGVAATKPLTKNETIASDTVAEALRRCQERLQESGVVLHGFVVLQREQTITDVTFDEPGAGSAELKKCVRTHVVGVHPAIELGKMPMKVRF